MCHCTQTCVYIFINSFELFIFQENLLNVTDFALVPQTYVFASLPTVAVEWITDEKSLNNSNNISVALQNYYTKVARGRLCI